LFRAFLIPAAATVCLLLIPFLLKADWDLADYIVASILLYSTGLTFALVTRKFKGIVYKLAVAITCASALFLVWANLAVGLIGSENNSVNLIYFVMVLVAFIAAVITKFRADSMAYIMFSMAGFQVLSALIILASVGINNPEYNTDNLVIYNGVHGFFTVQFILAGLLYRKAAHEMKENTEAKNG